jgi:hypothetical protein
VADHRHKREPNARRKPRAALVAGPIALVATASVVTLGVLAGNPAARDLVAADTVAAVPQPGVQSRDTVSRSLPRIDAQALQQQLDRQAEFTATLQAVRKADTRRWTTAVLNLWSDSGKDATEVGQLESGTSVLVTGRRAEDRVEVVVHGTSRWVSAGYLAEDKPVAPTAPAAAAAAAAPAGLSMEPCPDPGVESGLTSDAVYVYRSVCHAFPQITSYGGWDAHGEHSSGRALDIMTSDRGLGDAIAAFLQSHASELNLYDILWAQQIWTPVRSSEGWRSFASRGSATADHYDHVHVSTNG